MEVSFINSRVKSYKKGEYVILECDMYDITEDENYTDDRKFGYFPFKEYNLYKDMPIKIKVTIEPGVMIYKFINERFEKLKRILK